MDVSYDRGNVTNAVFSHRTCQGDPDGPTFKEQATGFTTIGGVERVTCQHHFPWYRIHVSLLHLS